MSATIGLIDVDGHGWPNLPLMKLSAWHKARGDTVEWYWGWSHYDIVYMSKVFDDTYSPDVAEPVNADQVIKGGTGYGLDNRLPDEVEHMYPDYSLYPALTRDKAYGFLTRGCPRGCGFCVVSDKEGRRSLRVADVNEFWRDQREIKLLDANTIACPEHMDVLGQLAGAGAWVDFTQGLDARLLTEENVAALNRVKVKRLHFAWDTMEEGGEILRGLRLYAERGVVEDHRWRVVYVLTNFGTTHEQDLYRVYQLRELGYDPYVMIYDKPHAPQQTRHLQRWVNNKRLWRSCEKFEDYDPRRG